jgi:hypothetical protein
MPKPLPAALSQKIAQSQLGTGPSFIPQAPKPKDEEEVLHPVEELIGEPEDLETLKSLVSSLSIPAKEIKRLEKIVDPIRDRIKAIVGQYGISKARCGEAVLNYFMTQRKTINATKLLAAGVGQDVIDQCTDVTPSYTLKIT